MSAQQLSLLNLALTPPSKTRIAVVKRDRGIKRALDHADRVENLWSQKAVEALRPIIAKQNAPFLAEDLIEQVNLEPPDRRAWGGVFQKLARLGVIKKVGYAPARTSNLSPKVLWSRV